MGHIHFIGICGTAMAPLAKALKDQGWRVTGSDKGIFPPISDYLRDSEIEFYVGFHPERIGNPESVVVGNFIGPSNPEFIAVQERGIPYVSYPEMVQKYLIKPESIVVAGTYGKTATAALLAWIWEAAGKNPSYMAAGILKNFPDGARITTSEWSIVEGDEYPNSRWKPVPKFDYYKPKYLLLTGADWDHADVYLTEDAYRNVFTKLVKAIPSDGVIVAAIERPNVEKVLENAMAKILTYGRALPHPHLESSPLLGRGTKASPLVRGETERGVFDWSLDIQARDAQGTTLLFHASNGETIGPCRCSVLGDQNLDHFAGAVGLARYCGIPADTIRQAVESFQGVRRRLEVRGTANGVTVVDDFAHSPTKAVVSLHALRQHFPHARIIAIFEPNVGNRVLSSKLFYHAAFADADEVIIPRLSATKVSVGEEERMDGEALTRVIRNDGVSVVYEPDDDAVIAKIKNTALPGDVVAFLGSHGFRGMIEGTLTALADIRT